MKHLFKVTYQIATEGQPDVVSFVKCIEQGNAEALGLPKYPSGQPMRVESSQTEPIVAMSSIIDG